MERWIGKYHGTVESSLDPEKRGRCLLRVPAVLGHDIISEWAEPAVVIAGPGGNWGECRVPPKGATVWVRFRDGNVNRPIYGGGWSPEPSAPYHLPNRALGNDQGLSKGTDSFIDALQAIKQEPDDPFAAEYPFNRVVQTESGHTIEYDDTPGHERIHIWHKTGSFREVHPDGTVVIRTVMQKYEIVLGDDVLHVHGTKNVKIDGDLIEYVTGNVYKKVGKDMITVVRGQSILSVDGQIAEVSKVGISNASGNNTHT